MAVNWEKFKSVIHYVCDKASSNPSVLGSIKLNKVLWYSDTFSYMISGKSITGEMYVKRQHGPVPKHVLKAVEELITEKKIVRGKVDHFGYMKNEFMAANDADVSKFSAEEIRLIDDVFEHVCMNHTATSVSAETHGIIWQIAEMGEEIPLYTGFASSVGEIDESDLAWAQEKLAIAA